MFALILEPMSLLPFDHLPAHSPRRFVPEKIDWGDGSQTAPLFDRLETHAAQCKNAADLESWLLDWSELNAAVDEESSRRYIAMTCHTNNAEAEKAYLHFVEHIEPQLKPRQFQLARIFVTHPLRQQLPKSGLRSWSATPGIRSSFSAPKMSRPKPKRPSSTSNTQNSPARPRS